MARVDADLAARMRRAWRRGGSVRRNLLGPAPAWYLCLEQAPTRSGGLLDAADAAGAADADGEEFFWRRGPHALWIDYPDAWRNGDDGGRWDAFIGLLRERRAPLAGVALVLEADHLLLDDPKRRRAHAVHLRRRLRRLCGTPVYVVVNRLDCLYGMRSLVGALDADRLARPLGSLRHVREAPDDLARRVVDQAAAEMARVPSPCPAAVQAPAELDRLRRPLADFCADLFSRDAVHLRGVYLASSAPGGGTIPPRMVSYPAFRELREDPPGCGSWFLRTLLREGIPADADAARAAAPAPLTGAFAAVAACCLVLCALFTMAFCENRSILLAARGRAAAPGDRRQLGAYLDLALRTGDRVRNGRLPSFGMREGRRLAVVLERRFAEGYFDLAIVPAIDGMQEAALAAAESGDPRAIGDALLRLAAARRVLEAGQDDLFRRLAGPGDLRQMEMYFAWTRDRSWMPAARDGLAAFERYLLDHANGGDLSWLPAWLDSFPGLAGVDAAAVWRPDLVPPVRVSGAWTADGYRLAKGLLDAVAHDGADWPARRDRYLAEYRREAVLAWEAAERRLRRERRVAWVGGPASRFADLAHAHLQSME